ncbi:MAG: radical SAM protein [Porphyromonadaceae bacterium]|nr:radical SAM protein [Porphyromonadaceae bacterium]
MIVNEIFYSLQGEGINTGRAAIFIRLSRCNLRCSFCDTEFDSGEEMSLEEIARHIAQYPARFIIWTGGEPTLQLTDETVAYFKALGYTQAIETNGTRCPPSGLDYITCSPKPEAMKRLHESFPEGVSEFRFPISAEGPLPPPVSDLPRAAAYLVSPIFIGDDAQMMDQAAVQRCISFVCEYPEWRLSLQTHKLINIR